VGVHLLSSSSKGGDKEDTENNDWRQKYQAGNKPKWKEIFPSYLLLGMTFFTIYLYEQAYIEKTRGPDQETTISKVKPVLTDVSETTISKVKPVLTDVSETAISKVKPVLTVVSQTNFTGTFPSDATNHVGDDDCISCYGVLYLSSERKKRGERPICFGCSTLNNGEKISPERMKLLDLDPSLEPGPEFQYIYKVGHSQGSGKMYRTGKVPLQIWGFEVQYGKSSVNSNDSKDSNSHSDNSKGAAEDRMDQKEGEKAGQAPDRPIFPPMKNDKDVYVGPLPFMKVMDWVQNATWEGTIKAATVFKDAYWKQLQKMYKSIGKVPSSMYNTANRLITNSERLFMKLLDKIKIIGNAVG
jgi:hypothetical protein